MTPDEYLAWEREQAESHEYWDGVIVAMSGGTPRHGILCGNLQVALRAAFPRCLVFASSQRVAVDDGRRYFYPDATVVCGDLKMQADTNDTIVDPHVVVEVISKSTALRDMGEKFEAYQRVPSITDYLLIAQTHPHVVRYSRGAGASWSYTAYGAGDRVPLAGGGELDVDTVYARAFDVPGDARDTASDSDPKR